MSEYMSDEERLGKLREWWMQNGTSIVIGVVVAIAGVFGWRWYQSNAETSLAEAADRYRAYVDAAPSDQTAMADAIVEADGQHAYPALVLFRRAQAAVVAGDLAAAETALTQAVDVASGAVLADLARLRLARVQHAQDRPDDAIATLALVRASGMVSLAKELTGDIELSRGARTAAHAAYTAALVDLHAEEQRTLLEAKIADTADASDA
ncbi:MAG: YfgM family protein [Gammaproteobacteria bacterium]